MSGALELSELLEKVFVYYCSDSCVRHEIDSQKPFRPVNAPFQEVLLLASVCSRWRSVALSTPQLWAHIRSSRRGSAEDLRKDRDALQRYVCRSRSCHLSMDLEYYGSDGYPGAFDEVFATLLDHQSRWKSITGLLPLPYISTVLTHLSSSMPCLETIKIRELRNGNRTFLNTLPSVNLSLTPRLTTFSFPDTNITFSPELTTMNFLKELTLPEARRRRHGDYGPPGTDTIADWLSLFSHSPAIATCVLGITANSRVLADNITTLSHLRSLCLSSIGVNLGPLLDRLRLPALEKLNFSMKYFFGEEGPWPSLTTLLRHSQPMLKELEVNCSRMTEEDLLDCLRQIPSLESLSLENVPITDQTLRALTYTVQGVAVAEPLCPQLLRVSLSQPRDISSACFESMVLSRWDTVTTPSAEFHGDMDDQHLCDAPPLTACLEKVWLVYNYGGRETVRELQRSLSLQRYMEGNSPFHLYLTR